MLRIAHHHAGAAVRHLHGQHACPLLHVERYDRQPCGQCSVQERHVFGRIAKQQADPVARLEPGTAERRRRHCGTSGQVAVGPGGVLPTQRHLVRVARGRREQQVYEGSRHAINRPGSGDLALRFGEGGDAAHRVEVLGDHLLVLDRHAQLFLDEHDDLEHAGGIDDAALEQRVVHAEGLGVAGEEVVLQDELLDTLPQTVRHRQIS